MAYSCHCLPTWWNVDILFSTRFLTVPNAQNAQTEAFGQSSSRWDRECPSSGSSNGASQIRRYLQLRTVDKLMSKQVTPTLHIFAPLRISLPWKQHKSKVPKQENISQTSNKINGLPTPTPTNDITSPTISTKHQSHPILFVHFWKPCCLFFLETCQAFCCLPSSSPWPMRVAVPNGWPEMTLWSTWELKHRMESEESEVSESRLEGIPLGYHGFEKHFCHRIG